MATKQSKSHSAGSSGGETHQQFEFLQAHGAMLCQGYLFSRPVPIEQFEAQLDLAMAD